MSRTVAYSAVAVAVACVAIAGGFYAWTETHKEVHGTIYYDIDVVNEGVRPVELVLEYTLTGDKQEWIGLRAYPLQMDDFDLNAYGFYLDPGTHTLRIPCHVQSGTRAYELPVDPSTFDITSIADAVRTDGGRPPA